MLKAGWDALTGPDANGKAAWKRWLDDHDVVRGVLIVLITACVLIPLGELLAIAVHKASRTIKAALARQP